MCFPSSEILFAVNMSERVYHGCIMSALCLLCAVHTHCKQAVCGAVFCDGVIAHFLEILTAEVLTAGVS